MDTQDGSTVLRTNLVAALGDHAVAAQCLRVAGELAAANRKGI